METHIVGPPPLSDCRFPVKTSSVLFMYTVTSAIGSLLVGLMMRRLRRGEGELTARRTAPQTSRLGILRPVFGGAVICQYQVHLAGSVLAIGNVGQSAAQCPHQ